MKTYLITLKNYIYRVLMILSAIYLVLRVVSIVLVKGFDFMIFSKTYEINLLNLAPSMDILMSAICFTVAFIYFDGLKRVVISFAAFLLFIYSVFMWFPMLIVSQSLTPIEDPSLTDNYAVHQVSHQGHLGEGVLYIAVYKEHYPLLYKRVTSESQRFSKKDDYETVDSFDKNNYTISEDQKYLYYGKMKIPLK
ncbi:hypothetical protein [Sporosarcina sp. P1]|uniref:hypothetical protein n=1 Tax=Sporosarcina sp. P1 TaxID=2048257 RepID=UPI000C16D421|nr:hypothetical protein [Sporosarcina sp. P1]PIC83569.1 hypothetical protein CSV73_06585 [Sporosarcina sp. P1]